MSSTDENPYAVTGEGEESTPSVPLPVGPLAWLAACFGIFEFMVIIGSILWILLTNIMAV